MPFIYFGVPSSINQNLPLKGPFFMLQTHIQISVSRIGYRSSRDGILRVAIGQTRSNHNMVNGSGGIPFG